MPLDCIREGRALAAQRSEAAAAHDQQPRARRRRRRSLTQQRPRSTGDGRHVRQRAQVANGVRLRQARRQQVHLGSCGDRLPHRRRQPGGRAGGRPLVDHAAFACGLTRFAFVLTRGRARLQRGAPGPHRHRRIDEHPRKRCHGALRLAPQPRSRERQHDEREQRQRTASSSGRCSCSRRGRRGGDASSSRTLPTRTRRPRPRASRCSTSGTSRPNEASSQSGAAKLTALSDPAASSRRSKAHRRCGERARRSPHPPPPRQHVAQRQLERAVERHA